MNWIRPLSLAAALWALLPGHTHAQAYTPLGLPVLFGQEATTTSAPRTIERTGIDFGSATTWTAPPPTPVDENGNLVGLGNNVLRLIGDVLSERFSAADEFNNILVDVKETGTGGLVFGVGFNADAGLVGSVGFVSPKAKDCSNGLCTALQSFLRAECLLSAPWHFTLRPYLSLGNLALGMWCADEEGQVADVVPVEAPARAEQVETQVQPHVHSDHCPASCTRYQYSKPAYIGAGTVDVEITFGRNKPAPAQTKANEPTSCGLAHAACRDAGFCTGLVAAAVKCLEDCKDACGSKTSGTCPLNCLKACPSACPTACGTSEQPQTCPFWIWSESAEKKCSCCKECACSSCKKGTSVRGHDRVEEILSEIRDCLRALRCNNDCPPVCLPLPPGALPPVAMPGLPPLPPGIGLPPQPPVIIGMPFPPFAMPPQPPVIDGLLPPRPPAAPRPVDMVVHTATGHRVGAVKIQTPAFEAQCDCVSATANPDELALEGNVRLTVKRGGTPCHIVAPRVVVNTRTGSFRAEGAAATAPIAPSTSIAHPAANFESYYVPHPMGYRIEHVTPR